MDDILNGDSKFVIRDTIAFENHIRILRVVVRGILVAVFGNELVQFIDPTFGACLNGFKVKGRITDVIPIRGGRAVIVLKKNGATLAEVENNVNLSTYNFWWTEPAVAAAYIALRQSVVFATASGMISEFTLAQNKITSKFGMHGRTVVKIVDLSHRGAFGVAYNTTEGDVGHFFSVYDAGTHDVISTCTYSLPLVDAAASPDHRLVAVKTDDHYISVVDLDSSGTPIFHINHMIQDFAFAGQNQLVAAFYEQVQSRIKKYARNIYVYDVPSGQPIAKVGSDRFRYLSQYLDKHPDPMLLSYDPEHGILWLGTYFRVMCVALPDPKPLPKASPPVPPPAASAPPSYDQSPLPGVDTEYPHIDDDSGSGIGTGTPLVPLTTAADQAGQPPPYCSGSKNVVVIRGRSDYDDYAKIIMLAPGRVPSTHKGCCIIV